MRNHGLELEKEEYRTLVPVLEQQWPGAGVDGWADIFWLDDGVLGLHESAAHRVDCLRIDRSQKFIYHGPQISSRRKTFAFTEVIASKENG